MIKSKVGLEAEFLLHNAKGDVIVPPSSWDRDGFPLLGEIRGKEGEKASDVLSNFDKIRYEIIDKLHKGHTISFTDRFRVPLKTYREANKAASEKELGDIKNIYGTKIEDFSDQIIDKGKIQGINVSCGLHVHFSCEELVETELEVPEFEQVILPITVAASAWNEQTEKVVLQSMTRNEVVLYRIKEYKKKAKSVARASKLNFPTIRWMVKEMDELFFDRFAPKKEERTKYRQPGYYELKPYGFEYRSLPANLKTLEAMPEIVKKAFALLKEANSCENTIDDDDE